MEAAKTPARKTHADLLIESTEQLAHFVVGSQDERRADRLAFECGMLRTHLQKAHANLETFRPMRMPGRTYIEMVMGGKVAVLVGIDHDEDDGPRIEEVWCGGQDICGFIHPDDFEFLQDEAIKAAAEMREDTKVQMQIDAREHARQMAAEVSA